ncbi:MAG: class I SAM-dependent methyltransferase [Pyrinomonadaceae bacterium]
MRQRIAEQEWTAHNVRLTPELTTIPGQPDFMETDLRLRAILRALSILYRDNLKGLRVADLGSLEGGFSLALAQRGMKMLSVEARRKNLDKAQLLKEHFEASNMELLCDDVKNFTRERFAVFDVVLALGILYHLDDPVAWLRQIAETARGVLVVDSHYAPSDESGMARIDERLAQLSPLEKIEVGGEVYEGRWFYEYGEKADREAQLWASYSNRSSFWLTKESLLRALMRAGFDLVLEQHDYSADFYKHLTITFPRGMFLAIKSSGFTGS